MLDEALGPAPRGQTGKIFILAAELSPGYWRDPEKTTRVFLSDPRPGQHARRTYRTGDLGRVRKHGLYEFLGRVDSQIKSRGYRTELREVEAALNDIARSRAAAEAGVDTSGFERTSLCFEHASVDRPPIEPTYLRRGLSNYRRT